ncbi:MAG: hypothetical protein BroJett011_42370 [Chloroflexota bacterium]|nr:MAG: hypothetical protein BroJett011_42370 [Chloroflexota bacterium]
MLPNISTPEFASLIKKRNRLRRRLLNVEKALNQPLTLHEILVQQSGPDLVSQIEYLTQQLAALGGPKLRKALFALGGGEPIFEGYTLGDYWNSWSLPYFDRAEAKKIVDYMIAEMTRAMKEEISETADFKHRGWYEPDQDAFLITLNGCPKSLALKYEGVIIDSRHVYSLGHTEGRGYWLWQEVVPNYKETKPKVIYSTSTIGEHGMVLCKYGYEASRRLGTYLYEAGDYGAILTLCHQHLITLTNYIIIQRLTEPIPDIPPMHFCAACLGTKLGMFNRSRDQVGWPSLDNLQSTNDNLSRSDDPARLQRELEEWMQLRICFEREQMTD